MNLLAIDSSGLVAGAAVFKDDKMVSEFNVNNGKTHSQTLLPMIEEAVRCAGLTPADVDVIAISKGPGSFTGLRIGSATAKGMGLALGKPLAEVSTLEALAYNLFGSESLVCPIMDARRSEVYTGVYEFVNDDMKCVLDETACPLTELLEKLEKLNRRVIFVGDGVAVYRKTIDEQLKVSHSYAPKHLLEQRAGSVGALGIKLAAEGKLVPAAEHVPTYLRLSQAEREMNEKHAE